MSFNSKTYLEDQCKKQYDQPPITIHQMKLTETLKDVEDEIKDLVLSCGIEGLQKLVKSGRITYADIATVYYNQVLQFKDSQAVITLNTSIIEEALDCTYRDTHDPLYGIPVLVKDNIAVIDMPTTAGAAILNDFYPEEDAAVIKTLKAKGALILGKSNLSEWANFMTTDSANGYSAVGGQTKNPFGTFDVGGSSAGSAVAVALQMSPVAIGTETAGSIIYPASQNGTVGLKPTLKTVSQQGIIPIAEAHDTAGPMARNVKDCYMLFKAMAPCEEKMSSYQKPLHAYRFGQLTDQALTDVYRGEDHEMINVFCERLKKQGATCIGVTVDEKAHAVDIVNVLLYQFKEGIRDYFKETGSPLTLTEILSFNQRSPEQTQPYGSDLMEKADTQTFTAQEIDEQVKRNREVTKAALDKAFQSVDVLVTLANYATTLYAASGYPALTLPGFVRATGEPIGVTLIGREGHDVELLAIGKLVEESDILNSPIS